MVLPKIHTHTKLGISSQVTSIYSFLKITAVSQVFFQREIRNDIDIPILNISFAKLVIAHF